MHSINIDIAEQLLLLSSLSAIPTFYITARNTRCNTKSSTSNTIPPLQNLLNIIGNIFIAAKSSIFSLPIQIVGINLAGHNTASPHPEASRPKTGNVSVTRGGEMGSPGHSPRGRDQLRQFCQKEQKEVDRSVFFFDEVPPPIRIDTELEDTREVILHTWGFDPLLLKEGPGASVIESEVVHEVWQVEGSLVD